MREGGRRGRSPDLSSVGELRSILIVRLKALGDIVLSLPIVYACRRSFPNARIRYLCRARYAEALSGVRQLDEVLILPETAAKQLALGCALRREKVECVIDLLGSPRSALLTYLTGAPLRIGMDTGRRNWCYRYILPRVLMKDGKRVIRYTLEANRELIRMLGLETDGDDRLDIGFPAAAREMPWAREYCARLDAARRPIIGIVPGAAYQAKSWPEERFIELGNLVSGRLRATPLVLWGPGEEELAERVARGIDGGVLAPPMGIGRLGAVLSMVTVLVGPDSGPKHLAVLQGVPTVTLFGPTDPRTWDPMTPAHRVVTSTVDCSPCRRATCVPNRCLADISPALVFEEIKEALAHARESGPAGRKGEGA